MAWIYEIESGRWSRNGALLAKGYSGAPGFVNDPSKINLKDQGPIPPGWYTIGAPILMHPKLGAYVLPLIPDTDNQMYNRDDFFNHGDNQKMDESASEGCIVTPLFARQRVGEGLATDNRLQVVSSIPGPVPEQWETAT